MGPSIDGRNSCESPTRRTFIEFDERITLTNQLCAKRKSELLTLYLSSCSPVSICTFRSRGIQISYPVN